MLLKAEINQMFTILQFHEHTPEWELLVREILFDNVLEETLNSGKM